MDNIASKIDKLYNQSSYSDKNGGSIFMTILILFVFFIAMTYFYVMSQAQPIKDNWVEQRCSPAVMPFAGMINAPDGQSAFDFTGDNFSFCTQNILKDVTGIFLLPINAFLNIILSVWEEVGEAINSIRNIINTIRSSMGKITTELMGRILNVTIPLQKVIISTKDMFGKVQGILTSAMFTFMGVYQTMMTGINASYDLMIVILIAITVAIIILLTLFFTIPIGLVASLAYIPVAIIMITMAVLMSNIMNQTGMKGVPPVPSCFAKGTKIKTKSSGEVNIENLKNGTELIDGSFVTSTMILSSHKETMFNLNNIIVSGSHKILYDNDFILVANHPMAIEIEEFYEPFIYCFNTTNKIIKIDNMIFCDWDDLDEMDLLEIKMKCAEIFHDIDVENFENKDIHKLIDSGLDGDTLIELDNGNSIKLKDVEVNDVLKFGERVIGVVEIDSKEIKTFKHIIDNQEIKGGANLIIFKTDLGIIDNTLDESIYSEELETNYKLEKMYHLLTDTCGFTVNGITLFDYNGAIESFLDDSEYYIITP